MRWQVIAIRVFALPNTHTKNIRENVEQSSTSG